MGIVLPSIIIIILILLSIGSFYGHVFAQPDLSIEKKPEMFYNSTGKYYKIYHGSTSGTIELTLPEDKMDFIVLPVITNNSTVVSFSMDLKPSLMDLYKQIGFSTKSQDVVFVYPVFTQAAYGSNGFYDYYNKKCDTKCLTVNIPHNFNGTYSSSIVAAITLNLLNYSFVTDVDVDKNPEILQKYGTVIMLHNEYVTKNEFNAIIQHHHVVYLYPNALYAEVKPNYENSTITLVRGHGYPQPEIKNGFNWKNDNTQFEYDLECKNWNFTDVDNGKMLNCYPDYALMYDKLLLVNLKDFSVTTVPEFGSNVYILIIASIIGSIIISSKLNSKLK